MTTTKDFHKKLIVRFLELKTLHNSKTAKIRKGIKSDYSCTVQDKDGKQVKVNFWINSEDLFYGIVGWGICTCVPVKSLI